MDVEKKSARSKVWFGLLILTPFIIVFWFLSGVIKSFSEPIHWLWTNFLPFKFTLPTFIEGLLGLFLFILFAYGLATLYYSRKTRLSKMVDHLLAKIPFIKEFWQYETEKEKRTFNLSELQAVLIETFDGVWDLCYITGRQEVKHGNRLIEVLQFTREPSGKNVLILSKSLNPTVPIPFTGFFRFLDEKKLQSKSKIIYLETNSQFAKIYTSFGFIGPELIIKSWNDR